MTEPRSDAALDDSWSWASSGSSASAERRLSTALGDRRLLRSLQIVLLCVLLATAAGFAIGVAGGLRPLGVARIEVRPDPALTGDLEVTPDLDDFVQAELLVLAGDDLGATVMQSMGLSKPLEITATQVGTTNVVEVTVGAATEGRAVDGAQVLIDAYRQRREQDLGDRVDATRSVVERQLDRLGRSSRTEAEYARLLGLRNQLQLIAESDQGQVRVVQRPRAADQSLWVNGLRAAVIGLVLGALLGLLVALLRNRWTPSSASVTGSA